MAAYCILQCSIGAQHRPAAEIWDVAVYSGVNISVGMQPAAATAVNLPDADLESD
jgi:hypothetical protein